MSAQGKHAIVTGASSGIGEALARALAAGGYSLTLVARREDRLIALAAELGTPHHIVAADLADPARAAEWLPAAEAALGPTELLINNAGVQIVEAAWKVDVERAERLMALDYTVPMRLMHAVIPGMMGRRRGAVVNVSSMAGLVATPGMLHYNAAKAALAVASETWRVELEPYGVHVLTVYPGPVATAMERAAKEKLGQEGIAGRVPTGTPDGLARLILAALQRRRARVIYPRIYGVARFMPKTAQWLTNRLTPRLSA